ncbi:MAG: hypothetical protein Q9214_001252 [Letrouitia sp. 1 TL-2023]
MIYNSVIFVGIARIYYAFKSTNTHDITWINADIMIWTVVECCTGTICASIPPMAPLLKKIQPPEATYQATCTWMKQCWRRSSIVSSLRQGKRLSSESGQTSLQELTVSGKGSHIVVQTNSEGQRYLVQSDRVV